MFHIFAPAILLEDLSEWFEINVDSPYMLIVANVAPNKVIKMNEEQKKLFGIDKLNIKRSEIPAVTHVDYSARIQTVSKQTNPKYFKLLKENADKLNLKELSMGMSADYEKALLYGASYLRLGTAILGKRNSN